MEVYVYIWILITITIYVNPQFDHKCANSQTNSRTWFICPHVSSAVHGPVLGMMTSSNGNIFRVTGPLCGEFTGPGEFPTQRPVTRSFDVFFDLRLNKWLDKQPWGWWFETLSWSLWRQCNGLDDDVVVVSTLLSARSNVFLHGALCRSLGLLTSGHCTVQ